jgi:Uma2 family endonuclease
MVAEATPRRMTIEEFTRLDVEEWTGNLIRGWWIPQPLRTWREGEVAANAACVLQTYARAHGGWSVAVNPGCILSREPDTVLGPAVGIIHRERRPTGKGAAGWLAGEPELVVEIGGKEIAAERTLTREYLAAGARRIWLLDPEMETVTVFTPRNAALIVGADETLDGGDVLPGFTCKVADLFE